MSKLPVEKLAEYRSEAYSSGSHDRLRGFMLDRRAFVYGAIALNFSGTAAMAITSPRPPVHPVLTPEMFGAKGDGRADDSAAFAALSDAINQAGGGTVLLKKQTYIVGVQRIGAKGVFERARLLEFIGCSRPLVILGNGARLRCADGQRYGTFDRDGSPVTIPKRGDRTGTSALTPYRQMIMVSRCGGSIEIRDLELDGNLDAHVVGGRKGDVGWQIPSIGLVLQENTGSETVVNVLSHRHALDGVYIDGPRKAMPIVRRQFDRLRADMNGRQGMSIVGGQDYEFSRSSFTRSGRGKISSAPAAGLDIEAERGKAVRNLKFVDCRFEDNRGCGMVADSGDSANVKFTACKFVGTTNWSAWPRKPGFTFERCTFVGSLVNPFGSPDPTLATKFFNCVFRDDPALTSTGQVYLHANISAELAHAQNVFFEHATFLLDHDGVLPWSVGPIWSNCVMTQRSTQKAHTRGTFIGTNRITGPVNLAHSVINGTLVVNGRKVRKTQQPS